MTPKAITHSIGVADVDAVVIQRPMPGGSHIGTVAMPHQQRRFHHPRQQTALGEIALEPSPRLRRQSPATAAATDFSASFVMRTISLTNPIPVRLVTQACNPAVGGE